MIKNSKSQEKLIQEFLDKNNVFAVVGVSLDPNKYGHKVFFDLFNAGYRVFAVHPEGGEVNGQPRYKNLASLPEKPDVVSVVVPPPVTEEIVKECKRLGIDRVWMQPGAESAAAIQYCRANNINVLANVCVMIERSKTQ